MFSQLLRFFIGLTIAGAADAAFAATEEDGLVVEGVRVFEPAYYDEFDPVTALDLVFRTPGFDPQESNGGRGLSRVRSNLLINGERPPPKGQSAFQQLREMPVSAVERIELIDAGARLDVDMQGYPQIVNVVTVADRPAYYEVTTAILREGNGDRWHENERNYRVEANGSFSLREHEFTLRGNFDDRGSRSPPGFVPIDPADPEQRLNGGERSDWAEYRIELGSVFQLPNDSALTFNGRFSAEDGQSSPLEIEQAGGGQGPFQETSDDQEKDRDVALEYRRPFGDGGEVMIALVDAESTEESRDALTGDGLDRASFRDNVSGETAARLMVTHAPTDRITLRVTATNAFNFFDGGFRLTENGVDVPIEGSRSRVEEDRSSLEAAVDWNPSDRWTIQAAVGGEAYEIESRDVSSGLQQDPKGELSVSFRPRPRTTWIFTSAREIGQLSFNQFLASSSLSSEILTAGAGKLEPERSWTHRASYDRRFGDVGVLRFELSRTEVDNPVRQVALSDSLVVARNTEAQTIDRAWASIELPFERFGREDLILSARLNVSQSETVDPITGEIREASRITSREWSLGVRRDPGDGRLAWGASIRRAIETDDYSVREIRESSFSPEWEGYVEWEPIDDLKIRTSLEGPSTRNWRSSFFGTVRSAGLDPSFIAENFRNADRSASISVEWRRLENLEISGFVSTRPRVREEESLTPFGAPTSPILAIDTTRAPRAEVRFRLYR